MVNLPDDVQSFLINLDDKAERLASATAQLERAAVPFTRISAVDGRGLDVAALAEIDQERSRSYMGRMMQGGEVGCFLSHVRCAELFLQTPARFALVIEDDIHFEPETRDRLQELIVLMKDRDLDNELVVNLGHNSLKYALPIASGSNFQIMKAFYFPMTTTMILWTRKGAERFLNERGRIFCPVDHYLRYWTGASRRGLAVWPPFVSTTGAPSDIEAVKPGIARKHVGRTSTYGWSKNRRTISQKLTALKNMAWWYIGVGHRDNLRAARTR